MSAPEVTLLPCPFCGGDARLHRPLGDWGPQEGYGPSRWRYGCKDCGAYSGPSSPTLAEAITAWNARAATTAPLLDVIEASREALLDIRNRVHCPVGPPTAQELLAEIADDAASSLTAALQEHGRG